MSYCQASGFRFVRRLHDGAEAARYHHSWPQLVSNGARMPVGIPDVTWAVLRLGLSALLVSVLALPYDARAAKSLKLNSGSSIGHLELGVLSPGTPFTVEAWVTADDLSDKHTLFEAVDTSTFSNSFYLGWIDGGWQVEFEDDDHSEHQHRVPVEI